MRAIQRGRQDVVGVRLVRFVAALVASTVIGCGLLFAGQRAAAQSKAIEAEQLSVSGIYPHLAVLNHSHECGIGAVVDWADRLWMITYPPHSPTGSDDKLYEIDAGLNRIVRPESVGGTHANRMIHEESGQLIIGPYFIDKQRNVRVVQAKDMPGRLTGNARHLTDPAAKVYFFTMEEGLYEVDVKTLDVHTFHLDGNVYRGGTPKPASLPGYHGKGCYSGQGHVVVSNNGERPRKREKRPGADPEASGCLAEWDGSQWSVIARRQFVEVTGPGDIYGNDNVDDPIWATGWDKRSAMLLVRDDGRWHRFRLPKASYTFDARHGWYTEWPRIRRIDGDRRMMTLQGMFWEFPAEFSAGQTAGIRPLSTYHQMVVDYCMFGGRLVLAGNHHSHWGNEWFTQAQSNLRFIAPQQLEEFGPPLAFGGVWLEDKVEAGKPSDPLLSAGFDYCTAHLAHDGAAPVTFTLEVDRRGDGRWTKLESIDVPADGYAHRVLTSTQEAEWIRVRTDRDCPSATALFHFVCKDDRATDPQPPMFAAIPEAGTETARSVALLRPRGNDHGTLQVAASTVDANGKVSEAGYYEVDVDLQPRKVDAAEVYAAMKKATALGGPDFTVDAASVIVEQGGRRFRLPKGNAAYDEPFACGWPRGNRQIVTERNVLNAHGTIYELPLSHSGGMAKIKPICTHNRHLVDFCTWRGLLVMSGCRADTAADGHSFRSADGKVALWMGAVDDLWALGKPRGHGGPWLDTKVRAGEPSDPYLMVGYDRKTLRLEHGEDRAVTFTVEVDPAATGKWRPYGDFNVEPGKTLRHTFPVGFSAHWVRVVADENTTASAQFVYE